MRSGGRHAEEGPPRWGGSVGALGPLVLEADPFLPRSLSRFRGGEGGYPKFVVDQCVLFSVDQIGVAILVGVDRHTADRPI